MGPSNVGTIHLAGQPYTRANTPMPTPLRWPLLLLCLLAIRPIPVAAQGVTVPLYTREVQRGTTARESELRFMADETRDSTEKSRLTNAADRVRARAFNTLTRLNDEEAAALWASPSASLLPSARVSPGTDRTALYTELGQAVSGGWRFVLGTALAVETTDEDEGGEAGAQQNGEKEEDPSTGFRRFVTGGGNLSFAAMRPLALQRGESSDHLIVGLPRIWANIPTLSDADGVEDFGGEIAGEYIYQRYARPMTPGGTLADKPELPFLTLGVRTGVVMGTSDFYRTVGHTDESAFLYTVPSLNLQFENGVRLGVSYFWGFGDFAEHENLRFHVTLAPPKRDAPAQADAPGGDQPEPNR